jgi:glucans biosynthesis protein
METMLSNFLPSAFRSCRIAVLTLALAPCISAFAFNFNTVANEAQQLAKKTYQAPQKNISKALEGLSYEQYSTIHYKAEHAQWRAEKLPFELSFFHQGRQYDSPVRINEIVGSQVRKIRFNPAFFDYGSTKLGKDDIKGLGFAGFRVNYAINSSQKKDEMLVFLGASYLRAVGKNEVYGLSARGLAVDTALNSGEEFPRFKEFWIEKPSRNSTQLIIYALLDSPRVSGAYRFTVTPGQETRIQVKTQLYLRENVTKLGIAPLTSMFFFGENQRPAAEDYRPEVHDSDGLSIASGTGEWIWRPLVNPKRLLVTSFSLNNPGGFGLMQRDTQASSYEDMDSEYERRPSLWITPHGKWGKGRVELVQIPTPDERNDNIVAYWIPADLPALGKPIHMTYTMEWGDASAHKPPLASVTQTRRGHGYKFKPDDSIALMVDFGGQNLKKLPQAAKVGMRLSTDGNAEILGLKVMPNKATGGYRAMIHLRRTDDTKPVEMRGFLQTDNTTLSETWSYILPPN